MTKPNELKIENLIKFPVRACKYSGNVLDQNSRTVSSFRGDLTIEENRMRSEFIAAAINKAAALESENAKLKAANELEVEVYLLSDNEYGGKITLERIKQFGGSNKWAIRRNGYCLGKNRNWSYEPTPSSRSDEFLQNYRFDSVQDALKVYRELPAAAEVE